MPASRPPIERIFAIHERLCSGRRVTVAALAAALEVSRRTVKRDIEYLRDRLGAPIAYDRARRGYVFERPFERLPLLRVSADEALAVAMARRVFAGWEDSALGTALTAALEKIAEVVGHSFSVSADELQALVVPPPGGELAQTERSRLARLLEAASARRAVAFRYRKPHDATAALRTVHPLHLARLDHQWTLIAFDGEQGGIRKFLLGRMEGLKLLPETFEPPAGFDPIRYLAGSIGRFTGEDSHEVAIRFDAFAAPFVREQTWRPDHRLEPLPDDGLVLHLRLNNLVDIQRYVLSWGGHAEALEPAELRRSVADALEEARARYDAPAAAPAEREPAP